MTGSMDTMADRMQQLRAAGWDEQLSYGKDTEPDVADVVRRLHR